MRLGVAQDTLAAWPAPAVRDTVAEIIRGDGYHREVTRSLWQHLLELVGRAIRSMLDALPELKFGNALIIALAVVLVGLVIVRLTLRARAEREIWAGRHDEARRGRRADPWMEAERHAHLGEYLEAAHALCAALLAACARRSELRLHPSKTIGDYARELRRGGAPSERAFQRFRARYDRVVYDVQRCSAEEYAALLAEARPLLAVERAA